MLRNRSALPVLQKTYDESYLTCSTAVYYESQGNEDEAMRCWKSALDQIYEHNANKVLPNYVPRTETERALVESLRQLELQCKERIDILEALRLSRQEEGPARVSDLSGPEVAALSYSAASDQRGRGWIGDGTIPAITYPELSRPPLPRRPSLPNRTSSEQAVVGDRRDTSLDVRLTSSKSQFPPQPLSSPGKKNSRSPSPEKHTMRTTLRQGRLGEKSNKLARRPAPRPLEGPGASKAASLAWNALGTRPRDSRAHELESTRTSVSRPVSAGPEDEYLRTTTASPMQWDSHSRRLVTPGDVVPGVPADMRRSFDSSRTARSPEELPYHSVLSISAASSAIQSQSMTDLRDPERLSRHKTAPANPASGRTDSPENRAGTKAAVPENHLRRKPVAYRDEPAEAIALPPSTMTHLSRTHRQKSTEIKRTASLSSVENGVTQARTSRPRRRPEKKYESTLVADSRVESEDDVSNNDDEKSPTTWKQKKNSVLKDLPPGVDKAAAKQILNEIVVQGDEVHWSDVAGLEIAKNALREAVVYPFLRPDLFMGLREPARGMLLFGPPGTGKTMLARAVATESKSTFFSISASSLTSKYLGESEKLVRALFSLAKVLAPSIIFVDEIDSLLSQRSGSGEHEATRRIKTEFLIQWSDLQRAAAGREVGDKEHGDANRVLVLAATNLPWAIDEAARRRFVRRQYIPLPEAETRSRQLKTLIGQQNHSLTDSEIERLVELTDGFSGSDITALAKDAAMGPLRSLGEALLHMTKDEIRPIELSDFVASLATIRPSVSKAGLKEYEDWAAQFGERGG